jgi:hypothetical protein
MDKNNLTARTTAGAVGYVRATSGVVSGSSSVSIVPAALDHIGLTPSNLPNAAAKSERQFSAIGRDVYDNPISGLTFDWTTNMGTINSTGLFTAQAGLGNNGYVRASNGSAVGSAEVSVTFGQLTHILVTPNTADIAAGQEVSFTAVGYDNENNPISGLSFVWTTNLGVMQGSVLKPVTSAGASGFVRATSGSVVADTFLRTVPGALDHIVVTPNIANISSGESFGISAVGYDAYNNTVPGLNFTWTTNVGKISGLTFTAQEGKAGTGYISATVGSVTGYDVVNIRSADHTMVTLVILVALIAVYVGYVVRGSKD